MGYKVISLILLSCFMLILPLGCSQQAKTDEYYINEWVKQTYGLDAKVTITAQLNSSITDVNLYRGVISTAGKELDGIFYFNTKDKSVNFSEIQ